ncbi:hypothetical protein E2C01_059170 [Portunus trituberculatus]|uniref:Uncharacterized protein n=1 Tax=Portunus trituberculatus TaxID=210409 RepID=A0A5B7H6U9_PORTR|nr:hypothetical protein [Portunus trituberculatus]
MESICETFFGPFSPLQYVICRSWRVLAGPGEASSRGKERKRKKGEHNTDRENEHYELVRASHCNDSVSQSTARHNEAVTSCRDADGWGETGQQGLKESEQEKGTRRKREE